jgi:hypothetical protein
MEKALKQLSHPYLNFNYKIKVSPEKDVPNHLERNVMDQIIELHGISDAQAYAIVKHFYHRRGDSLAILSFVLYANKYDTKISVCGSENMLEDLQDKISEVRKISSTRPKYL